MSKQLGIDFLRNRGRAPDGKVPVMEHFNGLSRETVKHLTGRDPLAEPEALNDIYQQLGRALDVDLNWGGGFPDDQWEPHDWDDGETVKTNRQGHPVVQWGIFHVVAQEDGRHFLDIPLPETVDDALALDPFALFPRSTEDYYGEFSRQYQRMLTSAGDVAYPIPHHYTTCFHWALAIFGFELLCEVGMEEDDFHDLISRFADISTRITTAWSQVEGLEGFILHDDLAMTAGTIFEPDWYRRHIIPQYPKIFAPLKARNIPIIFTSDGNCSVLVDDIFAAGADGFNIEYLVDMGDICRQHPDKIIIGNINNANIAAGPKAAIETEVTQCFEDARDCPGFVINVGGGLTHQIPIPRLEQYLAVRKKRCYAN